MLPKRLYILVFALMAVSRSGQRPSTKVFSVNGVAVQATYIEDISISSLEENALRFTQIPMGESINITAEGVNASGVTLYRSTKFFSGDTTSTQRLVPSVNGGVTTITLPQKGAVRWQECLYFAVKTNEEKTLAFGVRYGYDLVSSPIPAKFADQSISEVEVTAYFDQDGYQPRKRSSTSQSVIDLGKKSLDEARFFDISSVPNAQKPGEPYYDISLGDMTFRIFGTDVISAAGKRYGFNSDSFAPFLSSFNFE